ncbi:MAG TPA: MinD/ParA family protein [bacterium]|jgi:flagellar biosynthesis protein FlhG
MDQATTLRRIVQHQRKSRPASPPLLTAPRVIAITSGKGGVGKTNTVLNLSLALSRLQRRVLLLDADMGLANVDVLLGLTPRYTLEHVLNGQKDVGDVVLQGPLGLKILPSSSGISELSELSPEEQARLFVELSRIDEEVDYLFIDTGAGISSNVMRFNASAGEVYLVVSPEPTSMTDAYALMKLLAIKYHVRDFGLIANSVTSEQDGRNVFDRLNRVCTQYLQARLAYLGSVPFDRHVHKAVRQQRALLDLFPNAPAARSLMRIAAVIDQGGLLQPALTRPATPAAGAAAPSSRSMFWDRLLHWRKAK